MSFYKLLGLFAALILFFSPLTVLAQDTNADPTSVAGREEPTKPPLNKNLERKEETSKLRMEKNDQKKEIKENRKEFKEDVRLKREEMKEQYKERKEEFKNRLAELKDARKKAIVERIDTKMSTINTNHTDRMANVLEHMEEILGRLNDKVTNAASNGVDTTAAEAAIQDAQEAIDAAKNAVTTQAGKEYVITIGDEGALRNTVGTTTSQLRSDLQATHKLVIDAKQKVMEAATVVAQMRQNKVIPTITNSL